MAWPLLILSQNTRAKYDVGSLQTDPNLCIIRCTLNMCECCWL